MESSMKNKKKQFSSPPLIVSTNCSTLKSLYVSCRRQISCSEAAAYTNPTSLPMALKEGEEEAARIYRETSKQLENELIRLDTFTARFKTQIIRLPDGSYLSNFKIRVVVGRPSCFVAMQGSAPAIVPSKAGTNMSQVLNRMASMGKENLTHWLLKSMPMGDISGKDILGIPVTACCEKDILEAICLDALEKLQSLALEGIQIQTNGKEKVKRNENWERRGERDGEGVRQVMLIQLRDPYKEFEAVGDTMIGFIEATASVTEAGCGFKIEGVHMAGFSSREKRVYLWCVSMTRDCSISKWECVRNPDIVLDL